MISTAKDYAKTLRELNIAANIVGQADDIFTAVPQIAEEFANPSISLASKHNVIEKVFPLQIRDFLKLLCDNSDTGLWKDIVKAYREAAPERKGEFVVTLKYVTAPDDEQLQGIRTSWQSSITQQSLHLSLRRIRPSAVALSFRQATMYSIGAPTAE